MVGAKVQINMAALEDLEPNPRAVLVTYVLKMKGKSRQPLQDVILKLLTAWRHEPERILEFFLRDNPHLLDQVRYMMALDLLTEWPDSMTRDALEHDSFAKMAVLSLAGYSVLNDPVDTFQRAVADKKFGLALWSLHAGDKQIAAALKSNWSAYYSKLESYGNGYPYLVAQVLNGVMCKRQPAEWKRGMKQLAEEKLLPEAYGYFKEQGELFATNFNILTHARIAEPMSDHAGDDEELEPSAPTMDTTALDGAPRYPNAAIFKLIFQQHPEKAHLQDLVIALHGCWHTEPERILAFFLRDNPNLIAQVRELMGLDILDWSEPMWDAAVEQDSFARFATMVLAVSQTRSPPRQPASGLIEAMYEKKFQIAAAYIAFYGSEMASGINDRWTQLYWSLFESGDPMQIATAQMLNGMMKRHGPRYWERDYARIAKKLAEFKSMPIETCKKYVAAEAEQFNDAAAVGLGLYVKPKWEAYPGYFD